MQRFNKSQIKNLKDCIYMSNIHDARLEDSRYDRGQKTLYIKAVNPIHNVGISMIFVDVKVMISIIGNELGCSKTILSLTVEEDYSIMQDYTRICGERLDDSLYLLFQMFSGDELHIVFRELVIDIAR